MLIILTGKTASGKDTIAARLLAEYPNLKKILTATSRPKRNNEQNGVDYYFLTQTEFKNKIQANEFAEYVNYGGNLYGTFKKELEKALDNDYIWKIDPSRAGEVRDFIKRIFPTEVAEKLIKRLMVIYITASDDDILQRLEKRGLTKKDIQKRMADDQRIWQKYQNSYDFIVENTPGQLNQTINKILSIIENHRF